MRREQHDLSVRVDAQLRRRRRGLRELEELLDDPAEFRELLQVARGRLRGDGRGQPAQRAAQRLLPGLSRVAKDGVAFSGEAVLELDDRAADSRTLPAKVLEGGDEVRARAQVLAAFGQRHAGFPEDLAAPGLRAERAERRIDAVQRDSEQDREPALEGRRVEDGQVRPGGIRDAGPDALDHPRAFEDLLRQRARGGVVDAQQGQPRAGVAGGDPGQELQVVLEDERVHRLGRHVDHPRVRIAQPDEEEEQALLVEARGLELGELLLVEREGRDHDGGVRLFLARREGVPEQMQPGLQLLELGDLLLDGLFPGGHLCILVPGVLDD